MPAISIQTIDRPYRNKDFFKVPHHVYGDDPIWVPPLLYEQRRTLNPGKNPFFRSGRIRSWIAYRGRTPVGRILASIRTEHEKGQNHPIGYFGFFECIHDREVSDTLINCAESWLVENGATVAIGPVNLDTSNETGLLIDGFDTPPCIMMNHNPVYYRSLIEEAGYTKEHDILAYRASDQTADKAKEFLERMSRVSDRIMQKEGLVFRTMHMKDFKSEVLKIAELYNQLLNQNWGYETMTREEALFAAEAMKNVADPRVISFLEKDGKTIGCSFSMPDINEVLIDMNGKLFPFGFLKLLGGRSKINAVRVILLGVIEKYRHKGYAMLLVYRTITDILANGYMEAELSWVSEHNHNLISVFEKFGARLYKTYRVYSKEIS